MCGRGTVLAATAVASALLLSSCSAPAERHEPDRSDGASLQSAGPWKADFREALRGGVSRYEAAILEDGRVTSAELEDAHAHVQRCLSTSGLHIAYDPDGGFALESVDGKYPDDFFERSDPVLRACEKRYDEYVTMLFQETRRNPEKRDEAEITVACLRKAGLVGKDYSERQWRKEDETGEYSFPGLDPRAQQCRFDPLGLWRQP